MLAECDVTTTRDMNNTGTVFLDPDEKRLRAQDFEERLTSRILGQERAVKHMSGLHLFLAGMNPPNRPIGTMLFLGPTRPGKTRVIEAAAEVLYGDANTVVKSTARSFSAPTRSPNCRWCCLTRSKRLPTVCGNCCSVFSTKLL